MSPIYDPDVRSSPVYDPNIRSSPVYDPNIRLPLVYNPDVRVSPVYNPDVRASPVYNPDVRSPPVYNPDVRLSPVYDPDKKSSLAYASSGRSSGQQISKNSFQTKDFLSAETTEVLDKEKLLNQRNYLFKQRLVDREKGIKGKASGVLQLSSKEKLSEYVKHIHSASKQHYSHSQNKVKNHIIVPCDTDNRGTHQTVNNDSRNRLQLSLNTDTGNK
ncbi:hypothetical protein OTU49_001817 [Cherax quadricarinatus]|uniref:Uncharacterized protein n=1 Tax=Cherax quadricarinatus TaxID=27406 RepID=A0AAW0XRU1_CHEQU